MVNALQATSEKIHNEQSKIFLTHLSSISESEAQTYLLCSAFFLPSCLLWFLLVVRLIAN